MTRVAVSELVLQWAVERSGKPDAIALRFPKLGEWLRGESRPTMRQLEAFARATTTPLGYLFLPEPPVERLPMPHFRTVGDDPAQSPSPDLLETVQTMERRQAWMREYLVEQGHEPLEFAGSAEITEEPVRLAQDMKRTLGLVQNWTARQPTWSAALRELQRKIEEAGILVVVNSVVGNNNHRKLEVGEFRGFVLADEHAPLVFVNGADGKAAQMFTLAHEMAHIWFGSSAAFDLRELQPADDETELACNRVAAEFLVPGGELLQLWPIVQQQHDRFQAIARHFKVSELVSARRAQDLGLVDRREFLAFYNEYRDSEQRTAAQGQEGGNFYATQNFRLGRPFAEAVLRAVREEKLLFREAYGLTGLYGKAFTGYATFLGSGAVA